MEMMQVSMIGLSRGHNHDTGIDRYENQLYQRISDSSDLVIEFEKKKKPGKLDILRSLLFNRSSFKISGEPGLIHLTAPHILGIQSLSAKLVTTIHDLTPLIVPEAFSSYVPFLFKSNLRALVRRKNAYFMVNSDCTRKDFIEWFHVDEERIFKTPLGVGEEFKPQHQDRIQQVKSKYLLPDEYFLFTGAMNKRKNLRRVVEAFTAFKQNVSSDIKLVLAGRMNWGGSEVEKMVAQSGLQRDVLLPGYIADEDLPAVISGAKAMLYVSLYEGFGFPVLEAMKCGTPVIASNVSSIPEVAGDAAILVNPLDVNEITGAMSSIYQDKRVGELIERGYQQAAQYTWDKTAEATLEVYQKLLSIR